MPRISILVFLLVFLGSCIKSSVKDDHNCPGAPCVLTSIDKFKSSPNICSAGASVKEYKWEGKNVYVFDEGICIADGQSAVQDVNCKVLGYLGGISGNSRIEGKEWAGAVFVRTLWSN